MTSSRGSDPARSGRSPAAKSVVAADVDAAGHAGLPAEAAVKTDAADHASTRVDEPAARSRAVDSATLFDGADELHITHGDARYRLKRTLLGKLILTK